MIVSSTIITFVVAGWRPVVSEYVVNNNISIVIINLHYTVSNYSSTILIVATNFVLFISYNVLSTIKQFAYFPKFALFISYILSTFKQFANFPKLNTMVTVVTLRCT